MSQPFITNSDHYLDLVARQVDQYKETEIMHDLPPIFDYWSSKYLLPKFAAITNTNNVVSFYANYFETSLQQSTSNFLISIGSGDSSIEIAVVKELLARGVKGFFFICLELSPLLIEKARKKIDAENLGDIITAAQIDINNWKPHFSFAGVMAHHALHHILDLEKLFAIIKENLAPNGRFLTSDIIGRNGHMRWPEALTFMRQVWQRLPRKYKFHHQFQRFDDYYDNWDCASEGFEGIRSQDILPLLVEQFSFEYFYPYGNLIDAFIDRGFGPNFNPADTTDTLFIDYIESVNEQLISDGILKPTMMFAVMRNEVVHSPHIYKHWTPAFCVRDPFQPTPAYDVSKFMTDINFVVTLNDDPLIVNNIREYALNEKLKFTNNTFLDTCYLKYGWCPPDADFTWSSCEDAALIIPMKQPISSDLVLSLEFLVYQSSLYKSATVDIFVNDHIVAELEYSLANSGDVKKEDILIPEAAIKNSKLIEIRFMLPNRRQPQYESGPDLRAVGIGLISLKLS